MRDLAARQWRDYQRRQPGSYFGEDHPPLSLEQAYALQIAVADLRRAAGDAVAGYKVGCIGPGTVKQFGMSGPIHARLFQSEIHASGVALDPAAYANLAIEGEMAVRIGPDGGIAAAFPVIELHHFVFRGRPKTLVELIANNGINGGLVLPRDGVPTGLDHWRTAEAMAIRINGRVIESGGLWSMPGGVEQAVAWLDADLVRHGGALTPGDLVLTGTPLGLHPVAPGDRIVISIDGSDQVDCRIAS